MSATVSSPSPSQLNEELQQRLADPQVQHALSRLLDHLDTLSFTLEALDGFLRRGETVSENVAESVQELRQVRLRETAVGSLLEQAPQLARTAGQLAQTAARADLDALARSGLLERLTDPDTLEQLNQLLDRLPLVTVLVQGLEELLQRGEVVADSVADSLRELVQALSCVDQESLACLIRSLPKLIRAGNELVESGILDEAFPKLVRAGEEMLASGMLDPEVVRTLGGLGKTLADSCREAQQQSVEPVGGLWGLYRATRDPEVQKALGFLVAVAKGFARRALC